MKTEPKMKQRKKLILWISAMLLFAGSLSVGAQNVSFNNERLTLKQAFEKIESVSNYKIAYNASQLNVNKQVVLNQKNKSVTQVMDDLLSDTGCTYEIKGNQIVITPLESKAATSDKITVRGKVVDETGEGVIGASIVEKGTGNGTVTDYEGNFTVSNVSPNSDIEISYIGYTTQTVKANDGNKLSSIVLQQDDQVLSEVVVVGYGSQKRANLTGAVATISSKDINNRPVASAAGALQGADPSVNLTFNTGSMDSDYSIDIRGVASVNGGTPLILCDGMEVSLNQINPNDIESISVLKDASASAIYGAKASSGVILITTKSGKDSDGKVNVNYNGRIAWRKNTTSTDFITTGFDHVNIVNQFYNVYQGKLMWGYTGEDLEMLEARRYDETENPDRPWTVEKNGKLYFYSNFVQ